MKKILCIAASLLLVTAAFAQEAKTVSDIQVSGQTQSVPFFLPNEIDLCYGRVSLYSVAFGFSGILVSALSIGTAVIDEISTSGAVGFGYYHYFNPRFAVGGEGAFESISLTFKAGSNGSKMAPSTSNLLHIMPAVKGRWICKEHFGLYSKAAIGPALMLNGREVETDSEGNETITPANVGVSIALQLTPIGIEFGSKSFRGFTELGFGVQGMLLAGVRYSF